MTQDQLYDNDQTFSFRASLDLNLEQNTYNDVQVGLESRF